MSIFATIISIVLCVLEWKQTKNNKKFSPILFFLILWSFILFLSCFQLYGLYKPSISAILLLSCMVIFFYAGALIARSFPSKNKKAKRNIAFLESPNKIFYAICVIALIINIYDIILIMCKQLGQKP